MNPVPAFLREEVCAVSDHLAAISKFSSEDWMEVSSLYFITIVKSNITQRGIH